MPDSRTHLPCWYCIACVFFKDGHEHVHIQYQACVCTVNKFCKGPDVFWVAYLPRHSCLAAPGFGCSVMLQQLDWTVPRYVFGWVAGGNKKTENIEKKMQSGFLFNQWYGSLSWDLLSLNVDIHFAYIYIYIFFFLRGSSEKNLYWSLTFAKCSAGRPASS